MPDIIVSSAEVPPTELKIYTKPAIIHELNLETRAGSPLVPNSGFDPLGLDPNKK